MTAIVVFKKEFWKLKSSPPHLTSIIGSIVILRRTHGVPP